MMCVLAYLAPLQVLHSHRNIGHKTSLGLFIPVHTVMQLMRKLGIIHMGSDMRRGLTKIASKTSTKRRKHNK